MCKSELPLEEFNKKGDGLQPLCKTCNRERSRAYYHRNRDSHIKRVAQRNKDQRDIVISYVRTLKESTPCADCGKFYAWCVMDFDHVSGQKESNISTMISNSVGLSKIKKEIEKCEIVCSNCHRIRTFITRA